MTPESDHPGKKLRIAYIGLRGVPAEYSGIEKAVEEIGQRIAARGHDVTVYCMSGRYREQYPDYLGMKLRYLPSIPTKNLEMICYTFLATMASLRKEYDITHFQALGPSTLSFLPRLIGRKTVVTVHALDWRNPKWGVLAKRFLRFGEWTSTHCPDKTIAVSLQLKKHLEETYDCKVQFIPNGTSRGQFNPLGSEVALRYGIEPNQYLLFVGRITQEKHIHTLIEAFRHVETDMRLLIVGGTTDMDLSDLRSMASSDPRVVFAGPVYGDELSTIFSNAYFLVLPSMLEGCPVVLLEAMAFGTATLVSDIPENLEVIGTGSQRSGFTFRAGDVSSLRERLAELLANPQQVAEFGRRGSKQVATRFDCEKITDQVLDVYHSILASDRR